MVRRRVQYLLTSGLVILIPLTSQAQVDWDAGGGNDKRWFFNLNWVNDILPTTGQTTLDIIQNASGAIERSVYELRPDQNPLFVDPGIGSFRAQAPAGSTYTFRFSNFGLFDNTLTTTAANGNFFHDGAGAYRIQIDAASELRVGDPFLEFGTNPVAADLYGFELDLDGAVNIVFPQSTTPAVVRATHVLGWGPVSVEGQRSGRIVVGVHSIPLGDPPSLDFPGTIDCAFAGDNQPPKNPVTDSRWIIGAPEAECDLDTVSDDVIKITAGGIRNVGFWQFNSESTFSSFTLNEFIPEIFCNTFTMFPSLDARLEVQNMRITMTDFAARGPVMTFAGGSQLVYKPAFVQESANPPVINVLNTRISLDMVPAVGNSLYPCVLEFLDPESLLRPSTYNSCEAGCLSGFLNITLGSAGVMVGVVHIQTDVGHLPGRLFDASQALLFVGDNIVEEQVNKGQIEAHASDCCGIVMVEHLCAAPQQGCDHDSHQCTPLYNRCAKFWHDVSAGNLDIVDATVNQQPHYTPPVYPQEAIYQCKGNVSMIEEDVDRFYSADVENPPPHIFATVWTRYGDFDGDFDVDLINYMRLASAYTGPDEATWYPIADWGTAYVGPDEPTNVPEGDCDVDVEEYQVFFDRWWTDQPVAEPGKSSTEFATRSRKFRRPTNRRPYSSAEVPYTEARWIAR